MYHTSGGRSGAKADMPAAMRLEALYASWMTAKDTAERARIWTEMLMINADEVFTIGMINAVPQPVVISNRLRNVPETALYSWEPGAHFGIFRPDTFWLTEQKQGS